MSNSYKNQSIWKWLNDFRLFFCLFVRFCIVGFYGSLVGILNRNQASCGHFKCPQSTKMHTQKKEIRKKRTLIELKYMAWTWFVRICNKNHNIQCHLLIKINFNFLLQPPVIDFLLFSSAFFSFLSENEEKEEIPYTRNK